MPELVEPEVILPGEVQLTAAQEELAELKGTIIMTVLTIQLGQDLNKKTGQKSKD